MSDLSVWPKSSGVVTSPVATDPLTFAGQVTFSKHIAVNNDSSGSSIVNTVAAVKALVVQGAAAQSASLQEWQNSAGSALGSVSSLGAASFSGDITSRSGVSTQSILGQAQMNGAGPAVPTLTIGGSGAVRFGKTAADEVSMEDNDVFRLGSGGRFHWGNAANEQAAVGAAGAAAALPAAPTKYLKVKDSAGTDLVIPAYAAA